MIERFESGDVRGVEVDLSSARTAQPGKTMHGSLPFLTRSDPEPVQDVYPRAAKWPLAVLALGGVLTIAWIAFLLWAGFQVASWILG